MKATLFAAAILLLPVPALAQHILAGSLPPDPAAAEQHRPGDPGRPSGDGHFLFVSPMGEPFRMEHPDRAWFAQADTNHDGRIDRAEMRADAARFFRVLDRGHDGEIDPDDIAYYEEHLVPEVRSGAAGFGAERRGGFDSGGDLANMNDIDNAHPQSYQDMTGRQGAGRYGYLNIPEPITPADRNFNRGVDAGEWQAAADERFTMLDTNNDGYLTPNEFPSLNFRDAARGSGGRHGVGRRHGSRGGMGGL